MRFVDENIRPASKEDFEWAEAVMVSGMHIQRNQMNDICRRAHGYDLPVLGNMQPAGKYLGERFLRAGGVPAARWVLL